MNDCSLGYWAIGLALAVACPGLADDQVGRIDFNQQIRPLLSRHCFACHGRDEDHREAGLRLDEPAAAAAELDSGAVAIVPGDWEASELFRRITSDSDDERMPPADTGRRMTPDEVELIRRWISSGAEYARHWSFVKPTRPALPDRGDEQPWSRTAIDRFVLARLETAGLAPSVESGRHRLIRRLSLDLRGLPPSLDEVDSFVAEQSPDAYERLVDRYLADVSYGERWGRVWLDLARYADSRGFGSDPLRKNMWRYRDWVIESFNRDLTYDQFTLEQLAGDLLDKPTLEQQIATAFHRNTMTNVEGGTDDEEFRVAAVKDRVDTTIQVWMGLTMGCAKCHDHKYDPISQHDYYRFYAFFNQTADTDRPDEAPTIKAPTELVAATNRAIDQRVSELKAQLAELQSQVARERKAKQQARPVRARFVRIELPGKKRMLSLAEVQVFVDNKNVALGGIPKQSSTGFKGPARLAIDGNTDGDYAKMSTTHTNQQANPWWEVELPQDASVDRLVVWNRTDNELESRLAPFHISLLDAKRKLIWRRTISQPPKPSRSLAPRETGPFETRQQGLQQQIARLEKSRPAVPTIPVMAELSADKLRQTHVMVRGNFLAPGEAVQAGMPTSFHPLREGLASNRLGVAEWLMDPQNPLTARVAVNRLWGQLFGLGLVETEEDFGTQGELPSHPLLLDWLASEYQHQQWSTKRILRKIVTSATYRQTSKVTPELLRIDDRNRLLARGPRFRLDAETLRDQALALSGLLSRKLYGPSVYPYQPKGLWRAAFNGERTWPTSQGADKYRRGLYTFWRRTVPYPSMATFDAPSRELCTVRRLRTNTPLQAFVTLNDPAYVEMAQALARRIMREGGTSIRQRAAFGLKLCLASPPQDGQVQSLVELFESERSFYRDNAAAAAQMTGADPESQDHWSDRAAAAAWTVVANVLLNQDAVLTKN